MVRTKKLEYVPVDAKVNSDESLRRRLDVELFIIHPTMTPADITAALALEVNVAHRVGDQRKTAKRTLLQGQYADTRWRHSICHELREQWFADKIDLLVGPPHKEFLHRLRSTGAAPQ